MAGWGSLFDRITSWLPIQRPTERLRNELAKLEEKKSLLFLQKADIAKAKRMRVIERRITELHRLLTNKA